MARSMLQWIEDACEIVELRLGVEVLARLAGDHKSLEAEIEDLLHRTVRRCGIPPVAKNSNWDRPATGLLQSLDRVLVVDAIHMLLNFKVRISDEADQGLRK